MTENAVHVSPVATAKAPPATAKASFGVRHRRGFVTAFIIGILLTLVGALQTNEIPFWPRLAYWEILMMTGALIGLGVSESIQIWGGLQTRKWIEMPVIALLIALPLTMMVVGTSSMFFDMRPPEFIPLAVMFGITFIISLMMTALNYMMQGTAVVASKAPPPLPYQQSDIPDKLVNRFTDRLPLPMRGRWVIALQAEDHYLRVHLDDGRSTLILMRLSDAVAELPTGTGAQTHRSWWVAKDAVRAVVKSDGRAMLTLTAPLEAPVSRSFYKALNDAGWLV
jgi:DNA-binding LytR/AlgR family response regulator